MRRDGRAWGIGHGASGNGFPGFAVVLAATVLFLALLSGCPQRQQILEQTVGAQADDVAAEAEAGHVPDELLTWEMIAEIDHGFGEVTAVAFDERGVLYVGGDQAVRKFTADGQAEWELPVGGEPTCLTVSGAILTFYVGLKDRVDVYHADGKRSLSMVPEGERTWVTSVAVALEDVFVADAGNRRILRYSSGQPKGEIAGIDQERGIPALAVPSPHLDIEIAAPTPATSARLPTELVVANPGRRSIQYHSLEDGALLRSWEKTGNDVEGFGGCCNPTDIALLPDGRVVTSEKGLPRVKVYSENGELLSVVVPPTDFLQSTAGIDLDADHHGRVAVVDPERDTVRLYDQTDTPQETANQ